MNMYLLTHDIWFYATLLLLLGYIILGGVVLRVVILVRAARPKRNRAAPPDLPTPTASKSSLKAALDEYNDRSV